MSETLKLSSEFCDKKSAEGRCATALLGHEVVVDVGPHVHSLAHRTHLIQACGGRQFQDVVPSHSAARVDL